MDYVDDACVDMCDTAPNSHGTRIAGIISARTNNFDGMAGLTRGCRVKPYRIHDGCFIPFNAAAQALQDAGSDPAVRIINMSFEVNSPSLNPQINNAFLNGKLMVAAAGNCTNQQLGSICPPPIHCSRPVVYPASHESVMAVGSTDHKDNMSCFSKRGLQLDVVAPGEAIASMVNPDFTCDCLQGVNDPSFCRGSGTSYAAPLVAGLAALIWSVNNDFSDEEVRRIIMATADDLGLPGHDDQFGCGRINAFRAIRRAFCPANIVEDCVVNVVDFLALLQKWGPCEDGQGNEDPCCPADLDGSGTVDVLDFLDLLARWGCLVPNCGGLPPPSLQAELAAAGLTQGEWDTLQNCIVSGSPTESANCVCWAEHYLNCHRDPNCLPSDPVLCAGEDPLGHH